MRRRTRVLIIVSAILLVLAAIIVIVAPNTLALGLNDAPPDYVKEVVAYKEGSYGLMIYFILADRSGAMTTSDGDVTVTIYQTETIWSHGELTDRDVILYRLSTHVTKRDFVKTTVGLGAFEHEVILCPIGRVTYSEFAMQPTEMTGKVVIDFKTPDGRVLRGEEVVFF